MCFPFAVLKNQNGRFYQVGSAASGGAIAGEKKPACRLDAGFCGHSPVFF